MKNIYLLAGPSGSGKSSVARELTQRYGLKEVWSYTERPPRFDGLRYKGYEVSVEVHGDVEIVGFMNGHDFLYKNKQNTGAMNMAASDTLRTTFKSDAELWDALNADETAENKVAFENNSWIEAFVKDPKGHWHGSSIVDDADDVLDACGGISGWIDWLKENYIKEDKT